MRGEPEVRNCFQCGVSLSGDSGKAGTLLVNDYPHEGFRTAQPGRNGGVRPWQPKIEFVSGRAAGHLRLCRSAAEGAAIPQAEQRTARHHTPLPGKGHGYEPGAGNAPDCRLDEDATGPAAASATAGLSTALHG